MQHCCFWSYADQFGKCEQYETRTCLIKANGVQIQVMYLCFLLNPCCQCHLQNKSQLPLVIDMLEGNISMSDP